MPICITLCPFNWINLETEIWQDATHPAIEDRAAVRRAGSSAAFLLPTCPCPALLAAPRLLSPPLLFLVLGWNHLPLKLQRCPAIHTNVTRISACSFPALPSASRTGSCHSSRAPVPNAYIWDVLNEVSDFVFSWSHLSKSLHTLTAQQGWEDGCTLRETAHCLVLGGTDQAPSGTFPGTSYSSFPCWAVKTPLSAHNFFRVPGHSQLTNKQHYEN